MKLLFVGTNPENTGAARHFVALATAMARAGHAVRGIVSRRGLIGEGFQSAQLPVTYSAFRNAFDLRGYAAVLKVIARYRPDWLVGNFGKEYWPLILCGRLTGTQVALFRHRTPRMRKFSQYGVPRMAQRFIAVSEDARHAYLVAGVPADRVSISYNPVDLDVFKPDPRRRADVRAQFGIPDDAIVMGFAGRINAGKGVIHLMEAANQAMAQQPRLHALWVGSGVDEARLRTMAADHGLAHRHHFAGWVSDVERYNSAFSFLAFPSVKPETFGRVAIEAQASGVPVLGSDIGGIPETMRDRVTGFLVEPGNPDAWRDRILEMCDEQRCQAMGRAARSFVAERFGTVAVARDFEALLLGQSSPASVQRVVGDDALGR